jgi:peptidylprolyl isomerase
VSAPSPDQFVAGPVPEVDHATDLNRAPVIHAGVAPAPTELTGTDLVIGDGAVASSSVTVRIQYVGALYSTGETFDSSWGRGSATFPLGQVIAGFSQGIAGMRIGGRRELVIPSNLGYGPAGMPPVIPGDATLVFVIDLLDIS